MTAAIVFSSLGTFALLLAFVWWLVSWARKSAAKVQEHKDRIGDLDFEIEERDQAIMSLEDSLSREKAARAAVEKQRETALSLMETLAVDNPGAVSRAIRAQLARLQSLSEVPADDEDKDG